MTGNEYQKLAMRTINKDLTYQEQLMNSCLGLAGEVGEYNDIVKKIMFQGHPIIYENIKKELGDVCWYLSLACETWGFELDEIMQKNIDKLKARYPNGFETELSQYRKEGDV